MFESPAIALGRITNALVINYSHVAQFAKKIYVQQAFPLNEFSAVERTSFQTKGHTYLKLNNMDSSVFLALNVKD